MKNKRLIILLSLLVAAVAIFFVNKYWNKILPIKLNADKIEEIEISSNFWDEESENNIVLKRENDVKAIEKIATIFNESVKHENRKMGTTHPIHVKIIYKNGKEISFGCGVGAIFTVNPGKRQYNYINGELDEYIARIISDWEKK